MDELIVLCHVHVHPVARCTHVHSKIYILFVYLIMEVL